MTSPWEEGRPIFRSLPIYGYQENEVVDWIVSAYDAVLVEIQQNIIHFPENFIDPQTCRVDALDWLAQLHGFTDEYWDAMWPENIKRQLLSDSATKIHPHKGTFYLLDYLLTLFNLKARVKIAGAWRIGVTPIGSPIGGQLLKYSIVVGGEDDPGYIRGSDEWRLLDRLNRLYMPCWCSPSHLGSSFIHYHRWRVGRSAVGDPI
ncbi:MAG TPA: phage tail protein I [Allocoleopsis sp.]